MSNWIKCSDRMPEKEGLGYKCCIVRIKISQHNYRNAYDWFDGEQWENNHVEEVTHWFYLKDIAPPQD